MAPVPLGCCPAAPRCVLCPPPPPLPPPELVAALRDHYRAERSDGAEVWVGFYGGPPPPDALLAAAGDAPIAVRVRPDLLSRAEAARLGAAGVRAIELDALCLSDAALREAGRATTRARLLEMLDGLGAQGFEVGVVLAPGLPRTSHASAVEDAALVAPRVRTARIHPVLVLEGSRLQVWHREGVYRPLDLSEAVTVCRDMMDRLEEGGVDVIRVGVQPGPDGLGRAVAGPRHPSLRELVEARRTLDVLRGLLAGRPRARRIALRCAPADETRTRGPFNQHIRNLRAEFALDEVRVLPDATLERGCFAVERFAEEDDS